MLVYKTGTNTHCKTGTPGGITLLIVCWLPRPTNCRGMSHWQGCPIQKLFVNEECHCLNAGRDTLLFILPRYYVTYTQSQAVSVSTPVVTATVTESTS